MTRMQKICPCQNCGKTAMCVSHDKRRFFCNRCLPYFVRQKFYWMDDNDTKTESTKEAATTEKESSSTKKSSKETSKKSSSKQKK